ncbi:MULTISPECIES: nitric oxide synthase oxygenase [Paenibacillus]|uniref:Nitric oxide synthase oxygenase n=1 Tax=Paenibacillus validus TaxID=44253 RepID=A0A7X2ZCA5_9BACL|nr:MULTISPECIES: nitric oxide synthase oxygenase [Paenibacillus]MUG72214.1 nitric oxide synthase [Paenibacillus validus]
MAESRKLMEEAEQFVRTCYAELNKTPGETAERIEEIRQAVDATGGYEHTPEELRHGAKMAWRNSNRCIGRLFWESLEVFDARHIDTEADMAETLFRYMAFAANSGKIRPAITIFKPETEPGRGARIWNHQLIRYAGYETERGMVGDPASASLTRCCLELGWKGEGTPYDVLPLVLSMDGRPPRLFPIPKELVLEVPITHPEYPAMAGLGLKWYGVPMVSDMRLDIGGLSYTAAPFNGWYMGTEIGARNLADPQRYDMLPRVAAVMGLDTTRESSLWRDKALVELNVAVLDSYKRQGVTIVDHHTAASQFRRFEELEAKRGRQTTGDWTWLIPPMSPATTHVFHSHYENRVEMPNFFYQERVYETSGGTGHARESGTHQTNETTRRGVQAGL